MNITDIKQLSSYCGGLVFVDELTGTVRLVHYTTQKYFENIWEACFPKFHEVITDSCLTYLSYDAFEENRLQSKVELQGIQSEYPFFAYFESSDVSGRTSLHSAAHYGHATVAKLLLNSSANIETSGRDGQPHYVWLQCLAMRLWSNCFWKTVPILNLPMNAA